MTIKPLAIAALALSFGCSSSPSSDGTADITGTVQGVDLSNLDTAFAAVVGGKGSGTGIDVILTQGVSCADYTAGDTRNSTFMELFLVDITGSDKQESAPTAPGTFDADPQSGTAFFGGAFETLGADCSQVAGGQIEDGTVTVTSIAGAVVDGSVAIPGITGTFTTGSCPGVATRDAATTTPACHGQ